MGTVSEWLIAVYYRSLGFRVLHRNWLIRNGELDLVVRKGNLLVFVEVRSRRYRGMVCPLMSLNADKLRVLERTIRIYLHRHPDLDACCRFDVASVRWRGIFPLIEIKRNIELVCD